MARMIATENVKQKNVHVRYISTHTNHENPKPLTYDETPSPVLFYKPQGVIDSNFPMLAEDTFLLVIMTAFQASLFNTFSGRIVCLDSTHKTNQNRFKLLTVVVADEYRNGNYYGTQLCACHRNKKVFL